MKRLRAGVAFCLLTSALHAQKRDDEMLALMQSFAAAKDANQWLAENKAHVTDEVAAIADDIAADALSRSQLKIATVASAMAALLHLSRGERARSLESMLTNSTAKFGAANSVAEYADVRQASLDLATKAEGLDQSGLAFSFRQTAADCSYFAATINREQPDENLLLQTLADISAAMRDVNKNASRLWLEKFVSLTGAAITDAMERLWPHQDKFELILKQLAPDVESLIAVDFEFTNRQIGTFEKSLQFGRNLALFSYRYGNAAIASARLAIWEEHSRKLGNVELSVGLLHDRYRGEQHAGVSPAELQQVGDNAWSRAEELRNAYRSPTGRIWAGYVSEELFGTILRGELEQSTAGIRPKVFGRMESLKARLLRDRLGLPAVAVDTKEAHN